MKISKQKLKEIIEEEIKIINETRYVWLHIPEIDKGKVRKIMDKLKLKMGKHYDFGAGKKGPKFVLELDKKYKNKVLDLLIKNKVRVNEGSKALEKTTVPAQVKRFMGKFIDSIDDAKLNRLKKMSILYKIIKALGVSPKELIVYMSRIKKDL